MQRFSLAAATEAEGLCKRADHEGDVAQIADDMANRIGCHGVIERPADGALHLPSSPGVHERQAAALIGAGQLGHVISRQSCRSSQSCGVLRL